MERYRPRYAREFLWHEDNADRITLAVASEFFDPMPRVPENEMLNVDTLSTIRSHPHLFPIVTPFRITTLSNLLTTHPNQPFVASVCHGLRHGFWPWADTSLAQFPVTLDVTEYISDPAHLAFAEEQREKEIACGNFSPTFDSLLPGMLSVPVTVSTKARSSKLRLCVNHSAEPFARNPLISKHDVSVPLDNLHDLGIALRRARARLGPDAKLVVWKSDIR